MQSPRDESLDLTPPVLRDEVIREAVDHVVTESGSPESAPGLVAQQVGRFDAADRWDHVAAVVAASG
jgi:hypothetical protein